MAANSHFTYHLVRTKFHGGGLISTHRTLSGAYRAQKKLRNGHGCGCGAAVIVRIDPGVELNGEVDYEVIDRDESATVHVYRSLDTVPAAHRDGISAFAPAM